MIFHILDSLSTLRHYSVVSYDHRQSKRRLLLLNILGDDYPLNQDLKPILDRVPLGLRQPRIRALFNHASPQPIEMLSPNIYAIAPHQDLKYRLPLSLPHAYVVFFRFFERWFEVEVMSIWLLRRVCWSL